MEEPFTEEELLTGIKEASVTAASRRSSAAALYTASAPRTSLSNLVKLRPTPGGKPCRQVDEGGQYPKFPLDLKGPQPLVRIQHPR